MDSFYNGFASVCKAARTIFGRTGDMRRGTSHRKQKSITALCLALLLLASGTPVRSQQRVYFVDGYHSLTICKHNTPKNCASFTLLPVSA